MSFRIIHLEFLVHLTSSYLQLDVCVYKAVFMMTNDERDTLFFFLLHCVLKTQ